MPARALERTTDETASAATLHTVAATLRSSSYEPRSAATPRSARAAPTRNRTTRRTPPFQEPGCNPVMKKAAQTQRHWSTASDGHDEKKKNSSQLEGTSIDFRGH
jgi:hypothetical protein